MAGNLAWCVDGGLLHDAMLDYQRKNEAYMTIKIQPVNFAFLSDKKTKQ